jgi:hypothetical protein
MLRGAITNDRSKVESVREKAMATVKPDSEARAKKLVENLNKFNLTPESDLSQYISEMKGMGYTLQYSAKKSYWTYTPTSLANNSKIQNGIVLS